MARKAAPRWLLLDIGNSRIKGAEWDGRRLQRAVALDHHGEPAAVLARLERRRVEAIWIAHVLGRAHEPVIAEALLQRLGLRPQFARAAATFDGLVNGYAEPQRLGIDRWLMMLALWRERPGTAFCVVGAGTALTFDAVDARGRHQGGFIAAGLSTHQQAVLRSTRFSTRVEAPVYDAGLGRDTERCVRQGAILACVGAVERAVKAARSPARRVIAGGDAPSVLSLLGERWAHRPQLVLEGLLAYAAADRRAE